MYKKIILVLLIIIIIIIIIIIYFEFNLLIHKAQENNHLSTICMSKTMKAEGFTSNKVKLLHNFTR